MEHRYFSIQRWSDLAVLCHNQTQFLPNIEEWSLKMFLGRNVSMSGLSIYRSNRNTLIRDD